ncbi:MAG: hypothetical protein Q7J60_24700, partial [Bradyrhizobium sp.]|nr:hypothetical protein [Bradyrhizobium sp.]
GLAGAADFAQHDVAGVSFEFAGAQHDRASSFVTATTNTPASTMAQLLPARQLCLIVFTSMDRDLS